MESELRLRPETDEAGNNDVLNLETDALTNSCRSCLYVDALKGFQPGPGAGNAVLIVDKLFGLKSKTIFADLPLAKLQTDNNPQVDLYIQALGLATVDFALLAGMRLQVDINEMIYSENKSAKRWEELLSIVADGKLVIPNRLKKPILASLGNPVSEQLEQGNPSFPDFSLKISSSGQRQIGSKEHYMISVVKTTV